MLAPRALGQAGRGRVVLAIAHPLDVPVSQLKQLHGALTDLIGAQRRRGLAALQAGAGCLEESHAPNVSPSGLWMTCEFPVGKEISARRHGKNLGPQGGSIDNGRIIPQPHKQLARNRMRHRQRSAGEAIGNLDRVVELRIGRN